jgi:hypothetical protein
MRADESVIVTERLPATSFDIEAGCLPVEDEDERIG